MRALLALAVVLASVATGLAGDIRRGTTMQVKANSIWFQDIGQLTRWQALRKGGDAAALAAYQDELLRAREAWQFINPLKVKILGHAPRHNRVYVEMKGQGRMEGSEWFLDVGALQR